MLALRIFAFGRINRIFKKRFKYWPWYILCHRWHKGVCLWWNLNSVPLVSGILRGVAFSYCWRGTSFAIIVRCWKLTFFLCYLLSVTRCTCPHKTYQVCQSCERGKRLYWSALLMESILKSLSHNRYFFILFFEFAGICIGAEHRRGSP